ncbi:EF-hand domain-containing protein [[Clostridium] fimetarium]|uniref:Ca2+-binding protein, EF-hand superfamily n=1 Tax=[Clostridium] fimetarium TaxID=99656 RepID=A0A1I0N793_9FIRM|nr:EF-hand domain-containing protein [[Clostridium] fimetarium]SEV96272.1 Ca2+-binding protein, EF-hand superfamily [[Clostridium] fimetarium]
MINSVNSNSSYLSILTNNNLLNKLSETAKENSNATSFKVPAVASIQTSTSSLDSSNLSIEDHLRLMQSIQNQSTVSPATAQTTSASDLSSLDTDGDGTISTDEYDSIISNLGITDAPSAEDFFAQVDANSDGEISVDELKAQRPMGPPPTENQTISSDLDTDGDGTISSDEYDSILSQMGITDAPSAKDFFSQVDTNSDGEISIDELNAQNTLASQAASTQSISSVIDLDNDGTISTDEYDSIISKLGITDAPSAKDFFSQFDTNSDGKISVDELNAANLKASQEAATQSTSGQSLSEEFNTLAASMLNAYEANYQNMFNTDSTNLNNIA